MRGAVRNILAVGSSKRGLGGRREWQWHDVVRFGRAAIEGHVTSLFLPPTQKVGLVRKELLSQEPQKGKASSAAFGAEDASLAVWSALVFNSHN
jgi:hypothetical protein